MHIGFICIRYPKGIGILGEDFARLVEKQGHTVHFLGYPLSRRRGCLIEGEWRRNNVTVVNTFKRNTVRIDDDTLRGWAKGLDLVFTIEEPNNPNTFAICKELGIPTINYVDIEKFNPDKELYKDCSLFFCPTQHSYDKMFEYGVKNLALVRYLANPAVFPYLKRASQAPRFIHHAGWGGVDGRKGTEAVIKAYCAAKVGTELVVYTQKRWRTYSAELQELVKESGNIFVREINDTENVYNSSAYQDGHIVIQPSKWEGLGLTYIEALMSGLPVITTNAQPMNEYVRHDHTGLLVDCNMVDNENIPFKAAEVNIEALTEAIRQVVNNPGNIEAWSVRTQELRNQYGEYVESFFAMLDRACQG